MVPDPLSIRARAADPSFAALPFLVTPSESSTFGDVAARVDAALGHLVELGVRAGARVAFPGASDAETVVTLLALIEARAIAVPVHPRLTAIEAAALVDAAHADVSLDAAAVRSLSRSRAARRAPPIDPAGDADAPLAILFTSGTSGAPKGAVLSRGAFVASARASAENLPFGSGDVWLSSLPLAHVGGLGVVTRALVGGGAVALEPRFDPDAALDRIARGAVTLASVVPTMLDVLLERDRQGVLGRLRAALVGGAGASPALMDRCAERRLLALTTYGLTEACSQVTTQAPRDPASTERGSGRALPGVGIAIRDDDGARLGEGEGRIVVRGPTLMLGYDRGPGAPPDPARDAEGWFDTGDVGEIDRDGHLLVHARRTDLVVTGGENVYPAEIEQALEAEPGVRRAIVFGVPDPRWGAIVAAAVELDPGADLARVLASASSRLAPHKRPRLAGAVAEVALGATGKVERRDAFARYGAGLGPVARIR